MIAQVRNIIAGLRLRRKYVYVFRFRLEFLGFPIWIGKIGNAEEAEDRARGVSASIAREKGVKIEAIPVFAAKLFSYRIVEKVCHRIFSPIRATVFRGASGWTECFYTINPVTSVAVYAALYYWQGIEPNLAFILILIAPLPIDMILCVLFFTLIEYGILALLIWGAWVLSIAILAT